MTALAKINPADAAVKAAVAVWAEATTSTSLARQADIRREKQRSVEAFFNLVKVGPGEVTPQGSHRPTSTGQKKSCSRWKMTRI
jgi:hypothetical protein